VIHFALGELISLSIFLTLWLAAAPARSAARNIPVGRLLVSLCGGVIVAAAAGASVYVLAVRGLPSIPLDARVGGCVVAVAFIVRACCRRAFVRSSYVSPTPSPSTG